MQLKKIKLGNKEVSPFTIPSGIVTTQPSSLERIADMVPELGILTTKSIGPEPRAGNREPILCAVEGCPRTYGNAVGLTNPGAEKFAAQLSKINFPKDKFLLASIFGKTPEEFIFVARTLEPHVDGFELNLSCPHVKGHGMVIGQEPNVVYRFTEALREKTKKLMLAKLTPNTNQIGEIARAAIRAGADGIVAINTTGPDDYYHNRHLILTNKHGGKSGTAIKTRGLKCARDIREAIGPEIPMIVMGGISTAEDIREYMQAANQTNTAFGIGSAALAGMIDREIANYFATLSSDLRTEENRAKAFLKKPNMQYQELKIVKKIYYASDFNLSTTTMNLRAQPGQFVFAWIPNIGEKPFSVVDTEPLTLVVQERGPFTRTFNALRSGESFYIRGPYGNKPNIPQDAPTVLVGGGCGIAGLYLLAKNLSRKSPNRVALFGTRDDRYSSFIKEFERYIPIKIATENGSLGIYGTVADLVKQTKFKQGSYFFNCGPKKMIDAVLPLETEVTTPDRIYSSADYITSCGIGLCGKCADERGRRTCVEGPFMQLSNF